MFLLKLSEKDYYYVAYRFSTSYWIWFFLTLNSFELFFLLLCFLLDWRFLVLQSMHERTRIHTHTHARIRRHLHALIRERIIVHTNTHARTVQE